MEPDEIISLIKQGYWPAIRERLGKNKVTLRTRTREKAAGEFTYDLRRELQEIYDQHKPEKSTEKKPVEDFKVDVNATVPRVLLTKQGISLTDLSLTYWFWAKYKHGYGGTLSDFINEVVELFFKREGVEPVIVLHPREK